MDFSEFPTQWEWVALILGGVAILMAVQPFTQAIWGNPRIKITFRQSVDNGIKLLRFDIGNEPIYGGILSKLGVYRRTAEGVRADFSIYDSSGNQKLVEEFEATIVVAGEKQKQISLPVSMIDASVIIAETHPQGTSNILTTSGIMPIRMGLYKISAWVTFEGKQVSKTRLFTIGDTPNGTYWVDI